jgi:hypothetical protein
MSRSPDPSLDAIRAYLEREFPGRVRHSWWDQAALAHVFEVSHETVRHHVCVPAGLVETCGDVTACLRASELADYMREARRQDRRFIVRKEGGTVRIRSTAL